MMEFFAILGVWLPWIFVYLFLFWGLLPWMGWMNHVSMYRYSYWKSIKRLHIFLSIVIFISVMVYYIYRYYIWASNYLTKLN